MCKRDVSRRYPSFLTFSLLCPFQRYNAIASAAFDDLVPKSTGREAALEKRREKGAYHHRDTNQGGMEEPDQATLLGSGGAGEYQRLLAAQKSGQARQEADRGAKLSEYQAKEKEKMKALLSSLGLQNKYPMA